MKKSEYKSINSSTTKKISKDKGQNKNKGFSNSEGMKSGGCKCGCQAMTKSNCPDPFTTKTNDDKKPLIKSKDKKKY